MRKTTQTFTIALLLMLCIALPVYAQPPPPPMTVWGYVLIQTDTEVVTAPMGMGVYAKTDTTTVTSTTTEETGKYVLKIEGPPEGTPIDLWVEDVNVTRITLHYWTVLGNFNLTITVPALVADFTAKPTIGDEPLIVAFTDESTYVVAIDGWLWDFGDGETSTEQNPTHTYVQDGVYMVSLTVTEGVESDTETKPDYITVLDTDPVADFYGTPTIGPPPLPVSFTDLSTSYDGIASWSWTFGDGGTSAEPNPTHAYEAEGTYTVTLTVAEDDGDTDTEEKPDYIIVTVLPPDTEPPSIVYAEILYWVGAESVRPGHFEWVEDDLVGVGDGTTTTFSGRVKSPIVPGSVVIKDTETFTDDGAGGLSGDMGGTGTIDYSTGEFEVTFASAPADGQEIIAKYGFMRGESVIILAIVTDNVGVTHVEVSGDPFGTVPMEPEPEMPDLYWAELIVPEHTPPGNYTLKISALDVADNKATTTVTLVVAYAYTAYNVWLTEGWNLISLPLIPDNSSIEAVMAGVSIFAEDAIRAIAELHPELGIDVDALMPTVEAVWAYDATTKDWLFYDPATGVGDLRVMKDGWGYWLKVSIPEELEEEGPPAILTVHGVELKTGPVTPPDYHVVPGWNLIGYKSTYHMSAGEYLRSIKGKYAKIYGYSAWAQCFYWLHGEDDMHPGYGYWIYVTEEGFIAP